MENNNYFSAPNILTSVRIVLSLFLIPSLMVSAYPVAFALHLVAAISDKLDGYLARKFGLVSEFGKLLDRIADKILDICTFPLLWLVPGWPFKILWLIMFASEISQLRTIKKISQQKIIGISDAKKWGEYKMVLRCLAVSIFLYQKSGAYVPGVDWLITISAPYHAWIYLFGLSVVFGLISHSLHLSDYKKNAPAV